MSVDIYFQGFLDGEPTSGGGDIMRKALGPYVVGEEPEQDYLSLRVGDGTADVYLYAADMLANNVTGRDPWEILVRGARAAGWVILPEGCPTCLTREDQRSEVPEGPEGDPVLVRTGAELMAVVESH